MLRKENTRVTIFGILVVIDEKLDYGFLFGFRSWYILQHYDEYGGKNKPFITYMEFEETIRGSIA